MKALIFLAGLLAAGCLAATPSQYQQWTDSDGVVHFSGSPPPAGTRAVQKEVPPMPKVGTLSALRGNAVEVVREEELTLRQQAQSNREELARERTLAGLCLDALQVQCDQAGSVIDKLLAIQGDIRVAGASGNLRVMSEDEKQDRIDLAREFVRDNCIDLARQQH